MSSPKETKGIQWSQGVKERGNQRLYLAGRALGAKVTFHRINIVAPYPWISTERNAEGDGDLL